MNVETLIVGGGIGGLACARVLAEAGRDFLLVEAGETVGGAMRTIARDGFLLEQGPFNVIVRDPAFAALLASVAADAPTVSADKSAGRNRFVLFDGELRKVPTSPPDLARSGLLSAAGKARLLRGLAVSPPAPHDGDETIDAAARRRFGPEVADRIVSAVTSGIWAADSDRLSLAACVPSAAAWDREGVSPIGRMFGKSAFGLAGRLRATRRGDAARLEPDRPRGLVSAVGGLGAVCAAVAARLGDRVRTGAVVERIDRDAEGLRVTLAAGEVRCVNLVLTVGASTASRLVAGVSPEASAGLAGVGASSLVVLNLGFGKRDVAHPLDGYGYLVPRTDAGHPLLGVLFADSVFPHHAPPGRRLLRAFLGGSRDPAAIDRPDDQLLAATRDALRRTLGVTGDPVLVDVVRWRGAVPLYAPGHLARVAGVERHASAVPGLHLAGNYAGGVSVNDAVRRGAGVASRLVGAE